MPIVIAAIVIVIISRGIFKRPIIPRIKKAARKFGITPIIDSTVFLKRIKNIINIPNITIPSVSICDLKRLCNKLLNIINTPASLYSLLFNPRVFISEFILLMRSFLLKFFKESLILTEILASSFSTEM